VGRRLRRKMYRKNAKPNREPAKRFPVRKVLRWLRLRWYMRRVGSLFWTMDHIDSLDSRKYWSQWPRTRTHPLPLPITLPQYKSPPQKAECWIPVKRSGECSSENKFILTTYHHSELNRILRKILRVRGLE